jgi:hypothetical protein
MKHRTFLVIPVLLASILACNMPSTTAGTGSDALMTQVALTFTALAQVPTATVQPPATVAPGVTVSPTNTTAPVPGATNTSQPCNRASFVSDVTVPDNTNMDPNETFTKTWRLRNVGSCSWTSGYQLVFDSGDQMNGTVTQQLTNGVIASGQTIDVSVDLKAPGSAGTYKGNWRLREPGGTTFALSTGPFWVQIKVQAGGAVVLPAWPLRQQGDSGIEVFALQRLLRVAGEDLEADGLFGPVTKNKVQHFQSTHGLASDGIVGPQTWPQLIVQVQQGNSGQAVRAVQELLNAKGGYGLAIDGIFGPATTNAVKDWQDDHGLADDGIVGPQTWRSLVGT